MAIEYEKPGPLLHSVTAQPIGGSARLTILVMFGADSVASPVSLYTPNHCPTYVKAGRLRDLKEGFQKMPNDPPTETSEFRLTETSATLPGLPPLFHR